MKKICFVTANLNNDGGTERVGIELANYLALKGYKVVFVNITGGDKPFFDLHSSIKNISLFNSSGRILYRTPLIIYKLRKILKSEKVDVVIDIEAMKTLFTLPAVIGLKIKHICWEHLNFKNVGHPGRRIARQLAALHCDYIVTLTERDKNNWLNGTKHHSQVVVIPNPLPFKPQYITRDKVNKTVLAVGRLGYVKGYDLLLEAWTQVVDIMPDWHLIILGEGEERENLERIISDKNIKDSVSLPGRSSDVTSYYINSDILCLSSRFEGLPMVLIEALAYGLPVVSFDCENGPAEILSDTGSTLVPQGNINQLALSLVDMMKDDELRKSVSFKSVNKSREYEPSKIVNKWVDLIES